MKVQKGIFQTLQYNRTLNREE